MASKASSWLSIWSTFSWKLKFCFWLDIELPKAPFDSRWFVIFSSRNWTDQLFIASNVSIIVKKVQAIVAPELQKRFVMKSSRINNLTTSIAFFFLSSAIAVFRHLSISVFDLEDILSCCKLVFYRLYCVVKCEHVALDLHIIWVIASVWLSLAFAVVGGVPCVFLDAVLCFCGLVILFQNMRLFKTLLLDFEVKRFCNTWESDGDALSAICEES
ncbi:unnamed protein product [Prunus armeniaca]